MARGSGSHLSRSQRRTLDAICDTFAPGSVELGVPDQVVELARLNPSVSDGELRALLAFFTLRSFARRPRARRERVLVAWCDSRLAARRAAFQALRKGVLLSFYSHEHQQQRIGYPGKLGPPPTPREPRITITQARDLDCDVCVVGSGAGGGVAAAVLAQAGLDVVVLEAGPAVSEADFVGDELDAYRRFYWGAAAATTADGGIGLLTGECLGGTTTVNWTTAFRTPDALRREWGGPFLDEGFTRSLDAVCERSGVSTDYNTPSTRDAIMRRGLESLGWHVAPMPRNVRACDQGTVCGYCGFGCQLGAKQSTLVTWLEDAHAAGARIVVEVRAERVRVEHGRATGVDARTRRGEPVSVRARAIVVACGALRTPELLLRSGLRNANVGRHLHLHPVTGVSALFDEEVRPWAGTTQALYSDEHADLEGGYGLKYETGPIHPGVLIVFSPWRGAAASDSLIAELPRLSGVGILVRDRGSGEVRVSRRGRLTVRYRLAEDDVRRVRVGVEGAARILEAAGAKRVYSAHARTLSYEPGPGRRDRFLAEVDREGFEPGRCGFFSFHHLGSARLGASPRESACSWDGETWDVRGLYVMDGSSFPSASGVNPMITIEAIAHLNASRLAAAMT
ncbi:MAG TPA: GMC family oxidoreductase [Gaiellaceae bacterium]|nr:GMC family oxidoreductase [Gaiellaceae bacterium]